MSDDIGTTHIEVDTDDVDMDVVTDLCEFLCDTFERELSDGVTVSELVLAIGTVIAEMVTEDQGTMH